MIAVGGMGAGERSEVNFLGYYSWEWGVALEGFSISFR